MYKHSKPEKCQIFISKSYFTNIEFQNVNKAFVYIMDCNPSLSFTVSAHPVYFKPSQTKTTVDPDKISGEIFLRL